MYTACNHTYQYTRGKHRVRESRTAVGITSGPVRVDEAGEYSSSISEDAKAAREYYFPPKLLELAINFRCQDAEGSDQEHRAELLAGMGEDPASIDSAIHGAIAATALHRMLGERSEYVFFGDECQRAARFAQAVRCGCKDMRLSFPEELDTERNLELLLGVPAPSIMRRDQLAMPPDEIVKSSSVVYETLILCSRCPTLPLGLWQSPRLTSLELSTPNIYELPEEMGELKSLTDLTLSCGCMALPDSLVHLDTLSHLTLRACPNLRSLPDLVNLSCLAVGCCDQLTLTSKFHDIVQPDEDWLSLQILRLEDADSSIREAAAHALSQFPKDGLVKAAPQELLTKLIAHGVRTASNAGHCDLSDSTV